MALRLTVLIACLAVPAPAAAGLVTVEFEGVITEIRDDFERLPGVPVGAAFSGSYVYKSSVAPTGCLAGLSSGPLTLDECATYRMDGISTAGIRFELEGTEFVFLNTESPRWPLSIHTSLDGYRVSWLRDGSFGMDGTTLESQVRIDLSVQNGVLVETAGLALPELEDADRAEFRFVARREGSTEQELVGAELRSRLMGRDSTGTSEPIEPTPFATSTFAGQLTVLRVVPEPGAVLALALSLAPILASRRRCRREKQARTRSAPPRPRGL